MKMKVKSLSHVRLFATPWTIAYQTPQSMGFSRQEYWSGLPFPSPVGTSTVFRDQGEEIESLKISSSKYGTLVYEKDHILNK